MKKFFAVVSALVVAVFSLVFMQISAQGPDYAETDLSNGSLVIDESGYTQGGGAKVEWNGKYIIKYTGGGENTVRFNNVSREVILDNVVITRNSPGIMVSAGSDISLILRGANSVKFADNTKVGTAVEISDDSKLSIGAENDTDSLDVAGGAYGAGIGSKQDTQKVTARIVINGGVIHAVTGKEGAAVGGGRKSGAQITINGGNITAEGIRNGSGIGAGRESPSGSTVTVNGGIINATAKVNSAGIGGGFNSSCDTITINGGIINAKSAHANIGGIGAGVNMSADSCAVVINGGSVYSENLNTARELSAKNAEGQTVRLTEVTLPEPSDHILIDGQSMALEGTHKENDYTFYFYFPEGTEHGLKTDGYEDVNVAAGGNVKASDWVKTDEGYAETDLSNGSLVIDESGYTQGGGAKVEWNGKYIIKYTGGGENNVRFNNVSREVILDNVAITRNTPGIMVSAGSDISLILRGANSVKFADNTKVGTAVEISEDSKLSIGAENGTDSLDVVGGAYGAGIGSKQDTQKVTARIVINGGVIHAVTGNEGAAVGGGRKSGAQITINGGNITAEGIRNGPGMGAGRESPSGSTVTVNGGVINAKGDLNANGIGGGFNSSCDTITINGGVINAKSSHANIAGIGAGVNMSADSCAVVINGGSVYSENLNTARELSAKNAEGQTVRLTEVTLPEPSDHILIDGQSIALEGTHKENDYTFYFYFPEGTEHGLKADGYENVTVAACGTVQATDWIKEIGNAAEFANMQCEGEYHLTADIDLTALSSYAPFDFAGILDGRGHTVTTNAPIFKSLNGTVKNLTINGSITVADATKGAYCGCLACTAATTKDTIIEDVTNNATISVTDTEGVVKGAAGIVGLCGGLDAETEHTLTVKNCENHGAVTGKSVAGGIIGVAEFKRDLVRLVLDGCENDAVVTANEKSGGIAGMICSSARIVNCVNKGKIESSTGLSGGISGEINKDDAGGVYDDEFLFLRCVNIGEIAVHDEGGGILGCGANIKGVSFRNCHNFGKIHSDGNLSSLGGISGKIETAEFGTGGLYDQYLKYADCANYGEICANAENGKVGGICGECGAHVPAEYIRCGNAGKLTSGGDCGGISGFEYAESWYGPKVYCCFNRGDIEGNGFVSGLIAYMNCGYSRDFSHNYVAGKLTNNAAVTDTGTGGAVEATKVYKITVGENDRYFIGPAEGTVAVNGSEVVFTPADNAGAFGIAGEMSVGSTPLNRNVYKFSSGGNDYLFVNPLPDDAQAKVTAFSTDGEYVEIEATALKEVFPGKIKIRAFDAGNFTVEGDKCTSFKVPLFDSPIKTTALFWSNNNNFMFDEKSNIVKEETASIDYTAGFLNKFCAVGGTTNDATAKHAEADFTNGTVLNALNKDIEKAFYQNPDYAETNDPENYPTTDKMHILPKIGSASGATSGKVIWKYGDKTLYEQTITEGADYRYKLYGPGDTKFFDHWDKGTDDKGNIVFTANDGMECEMQTVLGSEIVVKLRMGLPAYICEDETAKMTYKLENAAEGEAVEMFIAEAEREEGGYVSEFAVPAKEMSDTIDFKLTMKKDWIGDETVTISYSPSIKQYAEDIIRSGEEKYVNAAVAMLNYGAAAQTYFGYKTDSLANAGLSQAGQNPNLPADVKREDFGGKQMTVNEGDGFSGIKFESAALNLKSKTGIRYFFTLEQESIDEYRFRYNKLGETAEISLKRPILRTDGRYMVEIPAINASALDDEYILTVERDGKTMTIQYSPFAYFNRMWKEAEGDVPESREKPLGQAFLLYHQTAKALLTLPPQA